MATKAASLGNGHPSTSLTPSSSKTRQISGAFTMFNPSQVKQFKEAFNMIDQDGDGRVSESDLKIMLSNLGQTPSPGVLQSFFSGNASDGINFTQFLTMMGEQLIELDKEEELVEAFACFDDGDKGVVDTNELGRWLSEMGDRMSQAEIDRLFGGSFTDRQGRFNYVEFAKVLRVNDAEAEREDKLANAT